jgi:hypothetical protein
MKGNGEEEKTGGEKMKWVVRRVADGLVDLDGGPGVVVKMSSTGDALCCVAVSSRHALLARRRSIIIILIIIIIVALPLSTLGAGPASPQRPVGCE